MVVERARGAVLLGEVVITAVTEAYIYGTLSKALHMDDLI